MERLPDTKLVPSRFDVDLALSHRVCVCLGGEPDERIGLKRHSVSRRSLRFGSGAGKLVRVAVGLEETPDSKRPTTLASWSQCQSETGPARPGWGWLQSKWITRGSCFPGNAAGHTQYSVFCILYSVQITEMSTLG